MKIETERLIITEFTMDMAEAVHRNSLDEGNRRFAPDEVFATLEEAAETVESLMGVYESGGDPVFFLAADTKAAEETVSQQLASETVQGQ